ncbi:MAG TPA: hypothetical protein DDW49_10435 [Deltaproteobacteria bacterium]|nr:MAG: hypothetical protein A2048_05900 [Deltaproteobacteria bacterium GWA2_45_12]HBF13779.1 hypothetical protein [Deltaproteobacteria bacterium]
MNFPHQLQSWRLSKALSVAQLARLSGVSRPNLVNLEGGNKECNLSTLFRLAGALQVTPGTLLDSQPKPEIVLNRHEADLVARVLLKKASTKNQKIIRAVQILQPTVISILQVAGIKKSGVSTRLSRARASYVFGKKGYEQLVTRLNKLAASLC